MVDESGNAIGFYSEGPPIVYTNARAADPLVDDDLVTLRYLNSTIDEAEFQIGFGADAATVELGSAVPARIVYPGYGAGEAADAADLTKFPAVLVGTAGLVITELSISFFLANPIPATDSVAVYVFDSNNATILFPILLTDLPAGTYTFSSSIGGPITLDPGVLVQVYVESISATGPTTLDFLACTLRCRTVG